jgi:hypothetical protein
MLYAIDRDWLRHEYESLSHNAVSQVVGFIKGKSAIHLARVCGERKRNFAGQHFWARGFFVNTVGRDEDAIRAYIRNQEKDSLLSLRATKLGFPKCGRQSGPIGTRKRSRG